MIARGVSLAIALAACACYTGSPASPGEGAGGLPSVAPEDAGAPSDVATSDGSTPDAAPSPPPPDPCADAGGRGSGSTFTDLYRDFFGPTGLASCSAKSICHVPGGSGSANSGGYQCAPDQATCWASMTATIVPDGGSATPETTTLYRALRKAPPATGSGPMPRNSTFAFCPDDLARIKAWISSGAAND